MMSPPLPGAAILYQLKNRQEHFIWQMFTAKSFHSENIIFYLIKEFFQPKMSPTSREREREGVRERGGWPGRSAGRHIQGKVRFERDRYRDRDKEKWRDLETKRHRDRTDNKNPDQSWVTQLVNYKYLQHRDEKKMQLL
jgi:hypothetical protein